MLILVPSTSLTLPSGRAKALVRGEGDGNPAPYPRRRLASWEATAVRPIALGESPVP